MTLKKACIMQSNYLPWKGYFDLIRHSDVFIFLDDVQYTKKTWRNRCQLKSPSGIQWLSVPVDYHFSDAPAIQEVEVSNMEWSKKHLDILANYYRRAAFYKDTMAFLEPLYEAATKFTHLSQINHFFLKQISERLGIHTEFRTSSELMSADILSGYANNSERIVSLCEAVGAEVCFNGPSAKAYTDDAYCASHGVKVQYADYSHYPEYPQLHGAFHRGVSIIDLMMMTGDDAKNYMSDKLFSE